MPPVTHRRDDISREPLLPGRQGAWGGMAHDNRRFIWEGGAMPIGVSLVGAIMEPQIWIAGGAAHARHIFLKRARAHKKSSQSLQIRSSLHQCAPGRAISCCIAETAEAFFGGSADRTGPVFGQILEAGARGNLVTPVATVGIVHIAAIDHLATPHIFGISHGCLRPYSAALPELTKPLDGPVSEGVPAILARKVSPRVFMWLEVFS